MHAGRSYTGVCPAADIRAKGEFEKNKNSRANKTYLILDQELDTLDGSSSSLRDGGRDTTHCYHESVSDSSEI